MPTGGGADDKASIQAVIDANPGAHVIGQRGFTYWLSTAITLPSGTTLDMPGCEVWRRAGGGTLLRNAAYLGTGARDKDITVVGGTWNHNSIAAPSSHGSKQLHTMVFHRVDGIVVRDQVFVDNGVPSKYAILYNDVTDYHGHNFKFVARPADGVHIIGPAKIGRLSNLSGVTGDDFVGVTGNDYPHYNLTPGGGDNEDLVIENFDDLRVFWGSSSRNWRARRHHPSSGARSDNPRSLRIGHP